MESIETIKPVKPIFFSYERPDVELPVYVSSSVLGERPSAAGGPVTPVEPIRPPKEEPVDAYTGAECCCGLMFFLALGLISFGTFFLVDYVTGIYDTTYFDTMGAPTQCVYGQNPSKEIRCRGLGDEMQCKCPLLFQVKALNYRREFTKNIKFKVRDQYRDYANLSASQVQYIYGVDVYDRCQQDARECHKFQGYSHDDGCFLALNNDGNPTGYGLSHLFWRCSDCYAEIDVPFDCTVFWQQQGREYRIVGTITSKLWEYQHASGSYMRQLIVGIAMISTAGLVFIYSITFCLKNCYRPNAHGTIAFLVGAGLITGGITPFFFDYEHRSALSSSFQWYWIPDATCIYRMSTKTPPLCHYLPACAEGDAFCHKLKQSQAAISTLNCECLADVYVAPTDERAFLTNTTIKVKVAQVSSSLSIPESNILPDKALSKYGLDVASLCKGAEEMSCSRYECTPDDTCCLNLISSSTVELTRVCHKTEACNPVMGNSEFACSYFRDSDEIYGGDEALMNNLYDKWSEENPIPFHFLLMALVGLVMLIKGLNNCCCKSDPNKKKDSKTHAT